MRKGTPGKLTSVSGVPGVPEAVVPMPSIAAPPHSVARATLAFFASHGHRDRHSRHESLPMAYQNL
jgi:hypothetical protein